MGIKNRFKLILHRKKWRRINGHNYTIAINEFTIDCVKVGLKSYGGIKVINYNNKNSLYIGNYCSIAQNVTFILDGDHYLNHISTYPFKSKIIDGSLEGVSKGNIIVDDDVWIGYNAIIMSGVHVGQGAVVAAGSVVTKDVPSYAIVAGIPAKVIKYRFDSVIINELLNIDYYQLTDNMIKEHINDLYVDLENVDQLEWLPKKY